MVQSNFKHIEFLPLDENNLIINDNAENNLRSKSCLNLGFNAVTVLERFENINRVNINSVETITSFLDLSYTLETVLTTLLSINTFSNPANTEVTEHYRKRSLTISSAKILPSFGYCQNLTFSRFKTWGGLYGTLSYYIHLLEDYEEYYTPSEIVYYAAKSLFQYSGEVSYNAYLNKKSVPSYLTISEFYRQASALIDNSDVSADRAIYNLSKNIIIAIPIIRDIFTDLEFYNNWIPKVLTWFNQQDNRTALNNPTTNQERASNTLLNVAYKTYENGLGIKTLSYLPSKFIRQNLSQNVYDLVSSLATVRTNSTYVEINGANLTEEELLVQEFHNNISNVRTNYNYYDANNLILETYTPPAGYTLFLTTLSTILINRAYIIAYRQILLNKDLFSSEEYKRILKLIGYGSILLIKSGLPHIQAIGINLLKTFRIFLANIDPNNLLDV